MSKNLQTWLSALALLTIVPLCGATANVQSVAGPQAPVVTDWVRASFMELNLMPALQLCRFTPPTRINLMESKDWVGFRYQELGYTDLTESEQRIAGVFHLPNGDRFSCRLALSNVLKYYDFYGRLPSDGVELLTLYTDTWTDPGGLARFRGLPLDRQLTCGAWRCVNPATGRFYESFSAKEWTPLGILVEPISGENAVKAMPGGVWDEETETWISGLVAYKMWRVVVYGEKPGSVLIDKEIGSSGCATMK